MLPAVVLLHAAGLPDGVGEAMSCFANSLVIILFPLIRDAIGLNDYITFSSLTKERTKNLPSIVAP